MCVLCQRNIPSNPAGNANFFLCFPTGRANESPAGTGAPRTIFTIGVSEDDLRVIAERRAPQASTTISRRKGSATSSPTCSLPLGQCNGLRPSRSVDFGHAPNRPAASVDLSASRVTGQVPPRKAPPRVWRPQRAFAPANPPPATPNSFKSSAVKLGGNCVVDLVLAVAVLIQADVRIS
jgi:hypothetical protein